MVLGVIRLNRWVVKTTHQTKAIDIFKDYSKISPCGYICFCTHKLTESTAFEVKTAVFIFIVLSRQAPPPCFLPPSRVIMRL